jgi:Tfp pilus assembly protein PilE
MQFAKETAGAGPRGKAERKVKLMSLVSLVALLAAGIAPSYVSFLPDWAEGGALALLGVAGTFLAGYYTRTDPDALSSSTIAAAQAWLKLHLPNR